MYVITGATGNTGRIITERLLAEGKKVRIISRNEDKAKDLVAKGAELCIGDQLHHATLLTAFTGADTVYAMISPELTTKDFFAYQKHVADTLVEAIEKAGIKNVVTLSSLGAQLEEDTGIINGLRYMENKFNIPNGNVLHLRPTYFMENIFAQIGVIKTNGIMGSPIKKDLSLPMIATKDIGDYAAKRLLAMDFTGTSYQYLLGQRDVPYTEVAKIIGDAIGRPDLHYVEFPYEGLKQALLGMGASESSADNMNKFLEVLNTGRFFTGVVRDSESTTPTSIEEFAKTFAHAYSM